MQNSDKKINRYFLLGFILIIAIFLFASLAQFFTAFLSALIFYVLSKKPMTWMVKKQHWNKNLAILIIIFISFFLILLPITALVSLLYNKIASVLANPQVISDGVNKLSASIKDKFGIDVISGNTLSSIQGYAAGLVPTILNTSLNLISGLLMMYFFLYFMLSNFNRMEAAIIYFLPFKKDKIMLFGDELVKQTFSNAVGIPTIAVVQGVIGFLSYWIAGVEQAGFWGVITGFASIIPVVGTGLVWAPMAAYLLITGATWQGVFVAVWGFLILGSMDNVVRFVLAKKMADVHPVVTVLGVIMGLKYFGLSGLIFGPLLISFFFILLKIYYSEYQKPVSITSTVKKRDIIPGYMQNFVKKDSRKISQAKPAQAGEAAGNKK